MTVCVVVGGQAGSEGKGAICAWLQGQHRYEFAVRVGGSNAGHTVVDPFGQRWPLRHVPVAAVVDPDATLVIAAGSELHADVLRDEVAALENAGYDIKDRLYVDGEATVVGREHELQERGISTGTTGKGVGAARAARALRHVLRVKDSYRGGIPVKGGKIQLIDTQRLLRATGRGIIIEGTQGYVLGTHAGHYPHVTSGNCRAIDFMAQAGLPPQEAEVWIAMRLNPIRIAGNSGHLAHETTWEALGVPPEQTTVTKKTRRVGLWDQQWANASVDANGTPKRPAHVALTFADYRWPELAGKTRWDELTADLRSEVGTFLRTIERPWEGCAYVDALGTGPRTVMSLLP